MRLELTRVGLLVELIEREVLSSQIKRLIVESAKVYTTDRSKCNLIDEEKLLILVFKSSNERIIR